MPEVEDDGGVAGGVSSALEEQTCRHGGCRSRRNTDQLVGADGAMTPELVVAARKRAPRRWWWFKATGLSVHGCRSQRNKSQIVGVDGGGAGGIGQKGKGCLDVGSCLKENGIE